LGKQLRGRQRTRGLVPAKLLIQEGVIEAGPGCIGCACAIVDGIESRPVRSGQAHGAGLATGVKLATGKREGALCPARRANGVDLAVGGGVVAGGNRVYSLADDLAVAHNDCGKRSACAAFDVLDGQHDGAAQELGIGRGGWGQLALWLPEQRK